jgi:hypothetical protein
MGAAVRCIVRLPGSRLGLDVRGRARAPPEDDGIDQGIGWGARAGDGTLFTGPGTISERRSCVSREPSCRSAPPRTPADLQRSRHPDPVRYARTPRRLVAGPGPVAMSISADEWSYLAAQVPRTCVSTTGCRRRTGPAVLIARTLTQRTASEHTAFVMGPGLTAALFQAPAASALREFRSKRAQLDSPSSGSHTARSPRKVVTLARLHAGAPDTAQVRDASCVARDRYSL